MSELIKCNRCNKNLSPDNYKKRKNNEYYKNCKKCNEKGAIKKRRNNATKINKEYNKDELQQCVACFKILNFDKFVKKDNNYTKTCQECLNKNVERKNNRIIINMSENIKICTLCLVSKDINSFSIHKDGTLFKNCKECRIQYNNNVIIKKNEKKDLLLSSIDEDTLLCNKCLTIKNKDEFTIRKTGVYNLQCNNCNINQMQYLENSKCEHGLLNKSMCKKCKGSSYCEHGNIRTYCASCFGGSLCDHKTRKDRCTICRNGNQFCKHDTLRTLCLSCEGGSFCLHKVRRIRCITCNFLGYLKDIVSSRIYKALKFNKDSNSIEYLGCDIKTFKNYIENKFIEGMSWDNYGSEWHIDHIIPIMYQNPTLKDIEERLHYLNTQPLWAKDNISKSNRYIG